jgi:hypothetical protein
MAVDMRWILAIRLCASKFTPARKPSKSSRRRITKRLQKNDGGSQLSTFPAACSVRRQAKHRDVLLGQSADGLAQRLRFRQRYGEREVQTGRVCKKCWFTLRCRAHEVLLYRARRSLNARAYTAAPIAIETAGFRRLFLSAEISLSSPCKTAFGSFVLC